MKCQEPRPSAKLVFKQKPTERGHTELFMFSVINNVLMLVSDLEMNPSP